MVAYHQHLLQFCGTASSVLFNPISILYARFPTLQIVNLVSLFLFLNNRQHFFFNDEVLRDFFSKKLNFIKEF